MLQTLRPYIALVLLAGGLACASDGPTALPVVSRIELTAATTTISPTQTVKITAFAYGPDNALLESAPLVWSSSAVDVATVNDGIVTGVSAGTAIIRVFSGTTSATISITVVSLAGVLTTVVVSTVDAQLELAQGTQAMVVGRNAQGGVVALGTRIVTWSSSNVDVATVNSAGGVNTVGVGSATITASVANGTGAINGSTTVTVVPIPNAPIVADVAMATERFIPSQTVIKLGGTVRFQFTAIDHNVIWTPRKAGSPADILVTTNTLVSRVFNAAGVFPFVCTIHPGMNGEIVVTP